MWSYVGYIPGIYHDYNISGVSRCHYKVYNRNADELEPPMLINSEEFQLYWLFGKFGTTSTVGILQN
jgi:hypothetical protein